MKQNENTLGLMHSLFAVSKSLNDEAKTIRESKGVSKPVFNNLDRLYSTFANYFVLQNCDCVGIDIYDDNRIHKYFINLTHEYNNENKYDIYIFAANDSSNQPLLQFTTTIPNPNANTKIKYISKLFEALIKSTFTTLNFNLVDSFINNYYEMEVFIIERLNNNNRQVTLPLAAGDDLSNINTFLNLDLKGRRYNAPVSTVRIQSIQEQTEQIVIEYNSKNREIYIKSLLTQDEIYFLLKHAPTQLFVTQILHANTSDEVDKLLLKIKLHPELYPKDNTTNININTSVTSLIPAENKTQFDTTLKAITDKLYNQIENKPPKQYSHHL